MSESEKRVSDEIDVEDVEPIDPLSLLQQNQIDPATELLLQAWIWHMLLPLGGQLDFIGDHGFEDMNVANLLKAHLWFETEDEYEPIAAVSAA